MSVLNELAAKLAALGVGTVGTDIFLGAMPEDVAACCALYEYGGTAPEFAFGAPGIAFENNAVQVVFRGTPHDYAGPRAKAETAYRGLAAVEVTALSGTLYHWIHPMQAPFLLRRDDSERVLIATNYAIQKELSA
jgi:hypothetical protein